MKKPLLNKIITHGIIVCSAILSSNIYAQTIEQQLNQCAQISQASARLSCFDTLTTAHSTTRAPIVKVIAPEQPTVKAAVQEVQPLFGFETKVISQTPERIIASITSLSKNPYGLYKISLDNGQVWKQMSSTQFKLSTNEQIFIKKGALGSFLLGKEGRNKSIRVKRVK
ncbi:MAG: hypothetical protein HRU24_01985 [Gammaproteobacteria bacterium]|nr:hypothetical protein [Gammaproteobacteria bacterium]